MNEAQLLAPLSAKERAKRQEATDAAVASARLEGLILPVEGQEIMQQYIAGEITWEERRAKMIALVR